MNWLFPLVGLGGLALLLASKREDEGPRSQSRKARVEGTYVISPSGTRLDMGTPAAARRAAEGFNRPYTAKRR